MEEISVEAISQVFVLILVQGNLCTVSKTQVNFLIQLIFQVNIYTYLLLLIRPITFFY